MSDLHHGTTGPAQTGSDTGSGTTAEPRQSVVKAPGRARRARLTPAPDTDPSPDVPVPREDGGMARAEGAAAGNTSRGENDDRLRQDRPPHW
ncbi:hypothetical protein [Leifsonia sp. A12D58]|uniref:hypothetical protein n=1 Tax=Leifsonia sp. A12D58 TaxID=3397674 RepID=UPI0039E0DA77